MLNEIHDDSGGSLQCLPYSRAMLDALSSLGKEARPIVIRGVVFGKQENPEVYRVAGAKELIEAALRAPDANGMIELRGGSELGCAGRRFPYRTIGFPHSGGSEDKTLGNYDSNGNWLGHLGVVIDDTLIDLTIGQLNDDEFNIALHPPALTIPVTEAFLKGEQPLLFIIDGMLIYYQAYPDEWTFESSKSWSDAKFRCELKAAGERTAAHYKGKPESELHDFSR